MSVLQRSTNVALVLAVLAAQTAVAPALAKGKSASADARRARIEGIVALNLGHYDDAADSFEDAYALQQDPMILFYLGQAYRLGAKPEKALAAYNAFLRTAAPSKKNRELFERAAGDIELIAASILLQRGDAAQESKPAEPVAKAKPEPTAAAPLPAEKTASEKINLTAPAHAPAKIEPPLFAFHEGSPSAVHVENARTAALLTAPQVTERRAQQPRRLYKTWWFWSSVSLLAAAGGAATWWYLHPAHTTPGSTWGAQRVLP